MTFVIISSSDVTLNGSHGVETMAALVLYFWVLFVSGLFVILILWRTCGDGEKKKRQRAPTSKVRANKQMIDSAQTKAQKQRLPRRHMGCGTGRQ